jgi:hypothetical protein
MAYMSSNDLYNIVREYDQTVGEIDIAYGNGFSRDGRAYFAYLCKNHPEVKEWAITKYPDCAEYAQ